MAEQKIQAKVQEVIYYINPENKEVIKKSFLVACSYGEGNTKIHEVDEFEKIRWFEHFGVPDALMTTKQKRTLVESLQISAIEAKEVQRCVIQKSGLYKFQNHIFYIIGNHCFYLKNDEAHNVKLIVGENLKRNYEWNKTSEEWQQEMYPERKPFAIDVSRIIQKYLDVAPGCSEILFTATLLASIKPILIDAGCKNYLNFIVNLCGESGSYKSALVNAICTVSASGTLKGSYAVDKKSDILKNLAASTGFVYVLDDYHEQATDYGKKRQKDILNAVVRQEESEPHSGLVVTSSEYLEGIASTQDRCIQIHVRPVDLSLLTQIQANERDMSDIVNEFVTKICENYDAVKVEARRIIQQYENNSNSIRANNFAKMLLLVAELFTKYVYPEGKNRDYITRVKVALEEQIRIQQQHFDQMRLLKVPDGDMVILLKMICTNVWEPRTEQNYQHLQNEILIVGKEYVCLTPPALKYGLKKYLNGTYIKYGDLIKHLKEEGILCCDESGDSTKKVSYTNKRALHISMPYLIHFNMLNFPGDKEIRDIFSKYQNN